MAQTRLSNSSLSRPSQRSVRWKIMFEHRTWHSCGSWSSALTWCRPSTVSCITFQCRACESLLFQSTFEKHLTLTYCGSLKNKFQLGAWRSCWSWSSEWRLCQITVDVIQGINHHGSHLSAVLIYLFQASVVYDLNLTTYLVMCDLLWWVSSVHLSSICDH